MIGVAYPSLLVGGAVGAGIALLLHLLAHTPPTREPLPTARFLTTDARTLLRLRQRPTDVPLLLVRIGFITALAAALAGLTWTGARNGTARIILLDAGADTLVDWDERVADTRRLVEERGGFEPVIVAYGLDAGQRIVDPSGLDRIVRGSAPASAQDGLRALRAVAEEGSWNRAEAVWLTRPAWRTWSPDLGLLRAEIWPGRATLQPAPEPGLTAAAETERDIIAWIFPDVIGTPLEAAIRALGVQPFTGVEAGSNPDWIIAHDATAEAATAFLDRAREGSSVVLSGRLPDGVVGLPWTDDDAGTSATSAAGTPTGPGTTAATGPGASSPASGLLLPWGMGAIGDAVVRLPGAPTQGARVVSVFEDALPAASSVSLGRGCVTYLAANVLDTSLTESDSYPVLIESLVAACADVATGDTPLDEGAIQVLERLDLPVAVDVAALGGGGTPLSRWLFILALLLLFAEIGMTRGRAS